MVLYLACEEEVAVILLKNRPGILFAWSPLEQEYETINWSQLLKGLDIQRVELLNLQK